ncbi:MAG: beta-galactosidase [Pseudomonadota bacterium]
MNLDGRTRHVGVCYYPEHWPRHMWPHDAARMAQTGITVVRIGEFSWSRIEPQPDEFHWAWLDDAVDVLAAAGLKVVMGTPTATPPRWVLTKHPDMLAVGLDGRRRNFGSRRHYDFAHLGFRDEAQRITEQMARRYGGHRAVVAWQLDNEYGCHDTVLSASEAALHGFRSWLEKRYSTIAALNDAWGNVFWSMEYRAFDEVALPLATVSEPNPTHMLDYRRFSSAMVEAFNRTMAEAVRRHAPGRPILHNYMGRVLDFDHFRVGKDLDIAAWDSYPLGFLEDRVTASPGHKRRFSRTGDPDFQAFHHDLYRAVGHDRWWVMEQQPGPVNWAPHNPVPAPGMIRLWCHEAFAHGAEVVSLFRWRQAPFAQEQMHAGLLLPNDAPAAGLGEVRQLAAELAALAPVAPAPSPVALVFDYTSAWAWEALPHGANFSYFDLVFSAYKALRRLGVSIDILGPEMDWHAQHRVILVPGLFALDEPMRERVAAAPAHVVLGPRTGSKTADFRIPADLPPDLPGLDVRVEAVESLRDDAPVATADGAFVRWREHLTVGDASTLGLAEDGWPVGAQKAKRTYIAGWPDDDLWAHILAPILSATGVHTVSLPVGVRLRDHGGVRSLFNYGHTPFNAEALFAGKPILGETEVPPAGVTIGHTPAL